MSCIFKTYTGNAILNNALMTIEALGKLKSVSEINPKMLLAFYDEFNLISLNQRLKNYTMLFTKNGPLHNDKTNGTKIYETLFRTIVENFENEGDRICEISGLKFQKTFNELYEETLKSIGLTEKEIKKKDTNIGRTWFPLIGGLGSDAQALPQAKFTVQIHPICIVILQFLPLSSILYKGGVLLVDSSNFELSREMIAENVKSIQERIEVTKSKDKIENIKDFGKGDYLLKAIEILEEKETFKENYSDLNLWSFSNSGTGASCEIDRVPNSLIKKLQSLSNNPNVGAELKTILVRSESAFSFIEALEDNKDWYLLYPNVFGGGKRKIEYEGVTPEFLDAYYTVIEKNDLLQTSKYIAGLIQKYKSKSFENLLEKTDAHSDPEYRIELYKVLIAATQNGEWDIGRHIHILDNPNVLPIKNTFYQIHKLSYYYYFKEVFSNEYPVVNVAKTLVYNSIGWIGDLIQNDSRFNVIKSNLSNANEYMKVGFNRIIYDSLHSKTIKVENYIELLYDENFKYSKWGLNELLRIYFTQPEQDVFHDVSRENELKIDNPFVSWRNKIQDFVDDYREYYFTKYQNPLTEEYPFKKFENLVNAFVKENDSFYSLLNNLIYNTNEFLNQSQKSKSEKWNIDALLTDPLGNSNWSLCVFTVKFLLKETSLKYKIENQLIN